MTSEEAQHQHQIKFLIDYYQKMISTENEHNRFRGCLYNKISMLKSDQRKFLQDNVPVKIGNEPVDMHKWI